MSFNTLDIVMLSSITVRALGFIVLLFVEMILNIESPWVLVAVCCMLTSYCDMLVFIPVKGLEYELSLRNIQVQSQNESDELILTVLLFGKIRRQFWVLYGLGHVLVSWLTLLMFSEYEPDIGMLICFGVNYGVSLVYVVYMVVVREPNM